ncbi:NADPH-dependent FMN reductase [Rhodococcus sp. 1168]|uniref:NADPH-dependent FMN reductase n=1 Tax=Rhodococcus sp. 1168 TaxID=2018041 RepID=UPI000A0E9AB3|nr:NAD(P)H-dependent oxidoreductase [Rhodococcus sp. 1168]ORI17282.1 NADPH-dependent FMN reductase [Rhodococcus sp. 1168]
MTSLRIAIVLGSTRPGRKADAIGRWALQRASNRAHELDVTFELVDIADYALSHLDEPIPAIMGRYSHAHTMAWAKTIASFDGFVFVTPEYNHSTSGALKNAIDFLFAEWNDKACGFVSYGVQGGQRAAEHLRLIAGELKLADVRSQVALTLGVDTDDSGVIAEGRQLQAFDTMLNELAGWARALRSLRETRDGR